jgi:hypothetical protein
MAAVRAWAAVPSDGSIAAAALNRDGHSVTIVDGSGDIYIEDPDTGHVERRIPGPRDLVQSPNTLVPGMAAIDSHSGLVAIVDAGKAYVYNLTSGATVSHLPGTDASFVAFAGDRLLVQRSGGSLDEAQFCSARYPETGATTSTRSRTQQAIWRPASDPTVR